MAGRREVKHEMPFLDHLEELRWRLIWSLGALGVGVGIGVLGGASQFDVIRVLATPGAAVPERAEARLHASRRTRSRSS